MKIIKLFSLTTGLVIILSLSACNNNRHKSSITNNDQQADSLFLQEWSDMEDSTQLAFDKFKDRLKDFEDAASKANKRIGVEKQQAIINMIAKQDSIENDLNRSKKMTKEEWNKFKTELQKELNVFKKNMDEFFKTDSVSDYK